VKTIWGDHVPKETAQFKYGFYWNKKDHDLSIELRAYRHGIKPSMGGLGQANHFREAVNLVWGEHNPQKKFLWNPWADRMLDASLEHKYLSVAGCANAGKSDFYAVYAIINWLADPMGTMVLITSTSLKESRGRIWGAVEEYWNAAEKVLGQDRLPGKLVSSLGLIKLNDADIKTSDRSGIHLIAGEKKKEKDTIGKMIGLKQSRVFLIADELPELSPAILTAAFSNLDANPFFQLIGIGNPNSIYDPHGIFSMPKDGWKSINPTMDEWETEKGFCIRFDAYKSPNVLAGRTIYPWLPTQSKINEKKKDLGEDTLEFWRMWRGYWCPNGSTETVVSEADIIGFDCNQKVVQWSPHVPLILLAFLDPGFTNGGDRSIAYFGTLGMNADTDKMTLQFDSYAKLQENIMLKGRARNFQIMEQYKQLCIQKGISPGNAGVDDTGAAAFGDIAHEVWSPSVVRVNFGGAATETVIRIEKTKDGTKRIRSCDIYKNRVTEIWCAVREYMRGNQIRGIEPDLGIELTQRKMVKKKSGEGLKSQVQPKEMMRDSVGFSPDIADAALGMLDIARQKHKFMAVQKMVRKGVTKNTWTKVRKKHDFYGQHSPVLIR
jgi:hypothetical protein